MERRVLKMAFMMMALILVCGCGVIEGAESKVAERVSQAVEEVTEIAAADVATEVIKEAPARKTQIKETRTDYSASRPPKIVAVTVSADEAAQDSGASEEGREMVPQESKMPKNEDLTENTAKSGGQGKAGKGNDGKKANEGTNSGTQPATTGEAAKAVEKPAEETVTPVIIETVVAAASGHVHEWTETNRSEEVNCFRAVKTTTIDYACACGETKTETMEEPSGCDWQWVGEWEHGYTDECHIWRFTRHTCVVHGTQTLESPQFEEQDNHDYHYVRQEPSCLEEGIVWVVCPTCKTYFPELYEPITNETYPDGGGKGHVFVETGRRELDEVEGWWYGEDKAMATFTCTLCGMSYQDIVDR